MQVDSSRSNSPALMNSTRLGSPFQHHQMTPILNAAAAGGGASTAAASGYPLRSKRRRRSGADDADEEDADELPSSQRLRIGDSGASERQHSFQPLGIASSMMIPGEDLMMMQFVTSSGTSPLPTSATTSEYGMDSPMHSLSLISRSPSAEEGLMMTDDEDVLMNSNGSMEESATSRMELEQQQQLPSMIPRQVKLLHSNSCRPVRPSPLGISSTVDSESSSIDSSPNQKMLGTNSRSRSNSISSVNSTRRMQGIMHRSKKSSSPFFARTPSPHPQSEEAMPSSSSASSSSKGGRLLHPSPGTIQENPFSSHLSVAGGRQMLRYTMGYRDDCQLCKEKVPGHYGHVVHRKFADE